jgi:hypothetical protein
MSEAPPLPEELDQGAAWLAPWVADQLRSGVGRPANLTGIRGEAMFIYGSVGVDAALTSLGEIWVGDYDLDASDTMATPMAWRRAAGVERIGFIVIAARRFAALRALLPDRPINAAGCRACRATGDRHLFSPDRKESLRIRGFICWECGGLGWRPPTV